mgnify:CR=1 FL=1|tara:strand:+ start:128 stop:487 length:360 start_codon:yes stop_codon:yes gene_type:complete
MSYLGILNNSKLLSGIAMILMNLGGRHITKDVPEFFDDLFENKIVRTIVVFCIGFVATKDIKIALVITLLFILVFTYLLTENSNSCIIPKQLISKKSTTKKQYIEALNVIKKYRATKTA